MNNIFYINACVRDESRTNQLAKDILNKLDGKIFEIKLESENIEPLNKKLLEERTHLLNINDFSDLSFDYAKKFASANTIVIAAPYWDLFFPSILKIYLERINVAGIVFQYCDDGNIKSLCNADKLIYVTTAGGKIIEPNLGYEYIKKLSSTFFGINEFEYYKAEGLDIIGADVQKNLYNFTYIKEKN